MISLSFPPLPTLRPFQLQAYISLEKHAHTLLVAPTGSGKSLIFQKYLLEHPSLRTILVSPLNALARQHAQKLKALGLKVSLGVGNACEGPPSGPGVWIVNPEKLKAHENLGLKSWGANFLIVDEAHCIWEWGEGFRPEFKNVLTLVNDLKISKSFWCTATLPQEARQEMVQALPQAPYELGEFTLPANLTLNTERLSFANRISRLKQFCDTNASGIVFVNTRLAAEKLSQYFKLWEIPALTYHAGMSQEERIHLERAIHFHEEAKKRIVVIATSAFGMGMDYPSLRFCILFEPSFNLLSLAQAVGRVGRSHFDAQATVFWHEDDLERQAWMTQGSERRAQELKKVIEWCKTQGDQRAFLENYFMASRPSGTIKSDEYSTRSKSPH